MRRLALVGLGLTALATRSPARADVVDQPTGDAGGALPGLVRVGTAGPLDRGLVVTGLAGYGYLGPVLAAMGALGSGGPARSMAGRGG